jgi:hypothetical protein
MLLAGLLFLCICGVLNKLNDPPNEHNERGERDKRDNGINNRSDDFRNEFNEWIAFHI